MKNYNQCITYNVQHAANKTGHLHNENNIIQRVHVLVLQCSHFHDYLENLFKSITVCVYLLHRPTVCINFHHFLFG